MKAIIAVSPGLAQHLPDYPVITELKTRPMVTIVLTSERDDLWLSKGWRRFTPFFVSTPEAAKAVALRFSTRN